MPKSTASTSQHVVKAYQANVPRAFIHSWLRTLGWVVKRDTKAALEMEARNPKAISEMLTLELLRKPLVFGSSKMYKPAKEPKSKAMLTLVPLGRVVHSVRDDSSQTLELCFNMSILNEVCCCVYCCVYQSRYFESTGLYSVSCSLSAASSIDSSLYGRMELTAPHGQFGRRIVSFEGYSNRSEKDLH
eukprot:2019028-Pleurochrysis_carterae.AAC.1